MNQPVILHIPHSSINIPFDEGFIIDKEEIALEQLKLTDWYTDDLFHSADDEKIIADFSRIFCDVERFSDDEQEIMSQFGMGVLYVKSDEGKIIRNITPQLRNKILNEFYWKHHQKFVESVDSQLARFGKALILDCHSYPASPLKRDLDQKPIRPDFNIGTDPFHTPPHLIELSVNFFKEKKYSLGIDWPYKGAIVPLKYYQQNKNVQSIMLEINRALYLKGSTNERSEHYETTKKITSDYIDLIRSSL